MPDSDSPHDCSKKEGKHPLEYFIGVFMVLTFVATAFAACYTRKQWMTADDTEKRSLRSYIGLVENRIGGVTENSIPSLSISFKNFGQTPAYEVRFWVYTKFDSYPQPNDLPDQPFRNERIVLFPTDIFGPSFDLAAPLSSGDISGLQSGARRLYVYGKVTYLDAFGYSHFTTFRLMYGGADSIKIGRMGWAEDRNGAN